jgi:AcrR family transcriptional regulator
MGTKERRVRERTETREKILKAAREMFAEVGYEAVTMRAIAERVEYTPTAIYHHFKNKQALVTELCHRDIAALASHFNASVTLGHPLERIRQVGEAYLEFAIKNPEQYRFMFMTELPAPEHSADYIAETRGVPERDAYEFLRRAFKDAIDAGLMREEYQDPDLVAQIMWSTLHGIISIQLTQPKEKWVNFIDVRTLARAHSEAALRGMLKDPSAVMAAR